ncbi:hypothetical protein LEP1GSC178_2190 [Leptospira licerasiae str. MMD4847]|uniref:Uncharacterized protein n=1 Tax=Leptospira licerasiae str. MMD4847 TaxID=1049971 RepID=A0ABN0HDJ4_9LEPT|nr:hypothetical protein LEP1GSC178_2190 [Leptospira licerasiae str. MMD4847]
MSHRKNSNQTECSNFDRLLGTCESLVEVTTKLPSRSHYQKPFSPNSN